MAAAKKQVEIDVQGYDKPFTFEIALAEFHKFQAELQRNPGAAANNFLLHTSTERERLKTLFDEDWGLPLALIGQVVEEIAPTVAATVKKRSASPTS